MVKELSIRAEYQQLLGQIAQDHQQGQVRAMQAVNTHLLATYWQVGQRIVEFEQNGKERAEYGKALIKQLASDLTLHFGKGFSRSNLIRIRQFYLAYPDFQKSATASHLLTWSHMVELLKIGDPLERSFYEQQSIKERWTVRQLIRQKEASLFLRLAASRDKAGILQLAQQDQVIEQPTDLLREPYVFEFLKIPEPHQISETQLETVLCDHLQPFLLARIFHERGRRFRAEARCYWCSSQTTTGIADAKLYR